MSIWCHCVGNLVFHCYADKTSDTQIINKTKCLVEQDLPKGSESELKHHYFTESNDYGISVSISLFGNLRDYEKDKAGELKSWFENLLQKIEKEFEPISKQGVFFTEFGDGDEQMLTCSSLAKTTD